jgi:hypothetical protein
LSSFFSWRFFHSFVATPAAAAAPPISATFRILDLERLPFLDLDLSRKWFTTPAAAAVPIAALAAVDMLRRRLLVLLVLRTLPERDRE